MIGASCGARDLTIIVSGNTGSKDITFNALIKTLAIKAPQSSTKYDLSIVDDGGFGRWGRTNLTGHITLDEDKLCRGTNTITISNSTDDGDFSVRVYALF